MNGIMQSKVWPSTLPDVISFCFRFVIGTGATPKIKSLYSETTKKTAKIGFNPIQINYPGH